jgi:hypothetical protein
MQIQAEDDTQTYYYFSPYITECIASYLWGTPDTWKVHYNDVITHLPAYTRTLMHLRATPHCHSRGDRRNLVEDDIEDNLYCEVCGEKTLWFPYLSTGDMCCLCRKIK